MTKTRSKLAKSASFFGAAVAALIAVSAQPGKAVAFDGGDCGGGGGPKCSETKIDEYCTDGVNVWVCGSTTSWTYYPSNNGG
jgi:hypothetical protein